MRTTTVRSARSEPLPLNPGSSLAPANAAVAGLMVELRRGTEAAKIALVAGFNLLCQQGRLATREPGGGGLH
jgi:hypothetical protein